MLASRTIGYRPLECAKILNFLFMLLSELPLFGATVWLDTSETRGLMKTKMSWSIILVFILMSHYFNKMDVYWHIIWTEVLSTKYLFTLRQLRMERASFLPTQPKRGRPMIQRRKSTVSSSTKHFSLNSKPNDLEQFNLSVVRLSVSKTCFSAAFFDFWKRPGTVFSKNFARVLILWHHARIGQEKNTMYNITKLVILPNSLKNDSL